MMGERLCICCGYEAVAPQYQLLTSTEKQACTCMAAAEQEQHQDPKTTVHMLVGSARMQEVLFNYRKMHHIHYLPLLRGAFVCLHVRRVRSSSMGEFAKATMHATAAAGS